MNLRVEKNYSITPASCTIILINIFYSTQCVYIANSLLTLSGGFRRTDTPVRKQDEKLASSKEELASWKNHFERVLNQECPTTVAEIGVDTLNIDSEVPTVEVKHAIKLLQFLRTGKPQVMTKFTQKY